MGGFVCIDAEWVCPWCGHLGQVGEWLDTRDVADAGLTCPGCGRRVVDMPWWQIQSPVPKVPVDRPGAGPVVSSVAVADGRCPPSRSGKRV